MIRSILSVGSLTLLSRVFGLVRDVLIALFLGAGAAADAFVLAFKLPNFFRRLFAEGAFSAAFVPQFSEQLGLSPDAAAQSRARGFAEAALSVLLPALLLLTLVAEIIMPWIVLGLTGGFGSEPDKQGLAVELTRLTFPYLMLISLVALFAGVLNGLSRFAAAAGAPVLLNVVLITALILFHGSPAASARALAAAVSVAGCAQLLLLVWGAHRQGFALRLRRPRLSPPGKRLITVMGPAALGAGAMQVNLLLDIVLASRFLPEGALSYLYYADRLNQLPLGVIGIAVATVLLPAISRALADKADAAAQARLNRGLEIALLITLPAAGALIAVPATLLAPIYQHGAFEPADTAATAAALRAYAIGLPAYVLVKILAAAAFARGDTVLPMRASFAALGVNLALNLILIWPLAHAGLALATALAAWANVAVLATVLIRQGAWRVDARLAARLPRIAVAALAMAVGVTLLAGVFEPGGDKPAQLAALAAVLVLGLTSYAVLARVMRLVDRADLARLRRQA